MAFVTRKGCKIFWRFEGGAAKPVLLLLHSIGTDMTLWDRALPYLLPQFRVLRMDLRGHGASDAPTGDYTLEMLASDALAVLDGANVSEAVVCGLSLGGMVAMTLALMADTRVSALVLACTSAAMDKSVWEARLQLLRANGMPAIVDTVLERFFSTEFRRTYPDDVETTRAGLLCMNPLGYAGCGAAIRDMILANAIAGIAVPTLVIAGTTDTSTPYAGHGDRIAAAIANAQTAMLDAAHLAAVEAPSEFAAALRLFVRKVLNRSPGSDYEVGLARRRQVLGDAWVDHTLARKTPFNGEFQEMITRHAWNDIWDRPGLDLRSRRLLVVAMTAALGRWEEFCMHVRVGLEQGGFTESELKEALMQVALYAGLPAANTAFSEAGEILENRKKIYGGEGRSTP